MHVQDSGPTCQISGIQMVSSSGTASNRSSQVTSCAEGWQIGASVWVPCEVQEAFLPGTVLRRETISSCGTAGARSGSAGARSSFSAATRSGSEGVRCVDVEVGSEVRRVPVSDLRARFDEANGSTCADNTALVQLNDASILDNMRRRYFQDEIYTYTASVLLAVNPNKTLPGLYEEEQRRRYRGKHLGTLPPHPFAIADSMYRALVTSLRSGQEGSQAVLISGESGAGKTETAKFVMKYLADRSHATSDLAASIQEKVLKAGDILESFGNAVTLRNQNSSRFGKYNRLFFDEDGQLSDASITTYLLESSRVCVHGANERTYHVFYEMLAGLEDSSLVQLSLARDGQYALTHGMDGDASECLKACDAPKFSQLCSALAAMGLGKEELNNCWQILAGLLHLGDVIDRSGKASRRDSGSGSASDEERQVPHHAEKAIRAAELLGMNPDELLDAALFKKISIPGRDSFHKVPRTPAQFQQVVHGLIKALYKRLFEHIVHKINNCMRRPGASMQSCGRDIGILDIYGFERLQQNSFEQLCINLANERLQQFFVDHVLQAEQGLYAREGLPWNEMHLPDSEPVVRCVAQVFRTLDDFSGRVAKGLDEKAASDEKFCERVLRDMTQEAPAQSGSATQVLRRVKNQTRRRNSEGLGAAPNDGFAVQHYAGVVDYTTKGWLSKNNDRLLPDCEALIRDSECSLVRSLGDEDRSSSTFRSVSKKYSADLESLLQMLRDCQLHYIRCFKPNSQQAAGHFDGQLVLEQLVQCGTVELVRIMHDGFPNRCAFAEIVSRFQALLPEKFQRYGSRTFIEALMCSHEVPPTEWALGVSRLFLKAGWLQTLEDMRSEGALPKAESLEEIVHGIVRRKWTRAVQVVCFCLWVPKFAKGVQVRKAARAVTCVAALQGSLGARLEAARHRIRRRRELECTLYRAAKVFPKLARRAEAARRKVQMQAELEAAARQAELEARQAELEARQAEEARQRRLEEDAEARKRLAQQEFEEKQQEIQQLLQLLMQKNLALEQRCETVSDAAALVNDADDGCSAGMAAPGAAGQLPSALLALPSPARNQHEVSRAGGASHDDEHARLAVAGDVRQQRRWWSAQRSYLEEDLYKHHPRRPLAEERSSQHGSLR
mmetsp:Transcript_57061/g.94872  ORF Transcript_57061/g.94872 Transcript_57061/m.94872 type:complete len:1125 (+) Transcript_57061:34-3408(+)